VLGLHRLRRALGVGRRHRLVVEDVAALAHRAIDPGVADDDDLLQRSEAGELLVDLRLDRRRLSLAAGPVDGDQRLRLRELHPLGDRFGREAAEDDVVGGADAGAGEHRDDDLGDHRQVDPDHVALLDPEVLEGVGEALDVTVQLGVGDVALLALLAAPVVGDPLAVAGLDVAVEALCRGVQPPVGEPLVEGRVGVVQPFAGLDVPVEQLLRLRGPPGLGVGGGLLVDLRVVPERRFAKLGRRLEFLDPQHLLQLPLKIHLAKVPERA
jgi:hypothetical protein